MAILKIHRNPHALTTEDKRILSDIHQYKHGGIYCEELHCSRESLDRLMGFIENHATPFDDTKDIEIE